MPNLAPPLSISRPARELASSALAVLALAVLGGTFLGQAGIARASDREIRVGGACSRGASSGLRLRAHHGSIRVRFRVDSTRPRSRWRVAIVHEGRVAWRARVRGGSLDIRRRLRDLPGADQIVARALGPGGITCIAVGTLPGPA